MPPFRRYAPLADADEQQPLAATAVKRGDEIGGADAPTDGVAAAPAEDTDADAPPLGTADEPEPEPSEAAEQPIEEEQEQQERGAEEEADSTNGSVAAAATREVDCYTDEQLMGAIESAEAAATLKKVTIWSSVTADGCRKFAERARQLQEKEGGMMQDFELDVMDCDWSEGQLASLVGVALGKLRLYETKGVTSADVAAFAEGARQLQEQEEGGMTRDFELTVMQCDWSEGQLASLAGVALSKLDLMYTTGVTSAELDAFPDCLINWGVKCYTDEELMGAIESAEDAATLKKVMIFDEEDDDVRGDEHVTAEGWCKFAERAQQLQEEGGMTRDFELTVYNCDWSERQLASLAGVALSKLSLEGTKGVTSADVAAFAEGARQLQEQEEGGMTRDFELMVRNCDWSDGQLASLAGVALSKLSLEGTKGVTSADVAAFAEGARQLQEQEEGGMTRDFVLEVKKCDWTIDHLCAALSKSGPSYGSVDIQSTGLSANKIAGNDLELYVSGCDWSEGQLASLAGVALSKLTLDSTKGMTSEDVIAFAKGARQLQEQEEGGMTRDFVLEVKKCDWSMDHLRAALSKSGPLYGSFVLPDGDMYGADWTRFVAKKIVDKELRVANITVPSSLELSAFIELVVAILRSLAMAAGSDSSADELCETCAEGATGRGENDLSDKQRVAISVGELKDKYPAVCSVVSLHEFTVKVEENYAEGIYEESEKQVPALVPTDVPPLQLAVAMAAHCKEWAALYPSDTDTLEDFATQFDEHAAALLDQCNSAQEAERLLLAHFNGDKKLAGGSAVPVLDFALRHDVRSFAANRWVQGYATELWTGADVHFAPRNGDDKGAVGGASEIIELLHSTHLATQLLAVPLLCLGTSLATMPITCLSLLGFGPWAVVPVSIGLGALAVTQLGIWSLWTWLLLVLLLLASAFSWLTRNKFNRARAHNSSRQGFLIISLAWNTPFIKYSLFVQLYLFFVLAITTLATADRHVVGWPELAVYTFGAGLLVAEVTQLRHGKTAGWWKELRNHLSSLWNVLDVSIVGLIAICAYQRLSLTFTTENANAGSGSSVAAESMEQGSGSAAAMNADEITEWRVEDSMAGQAAISALCIVVWLRLLGLMVLSADLGPLIQMVVEMRNDLTKFLLLCVVFVLGFGASISALLFGDHRSSIGSLAGALHATAQGLLGTQDMDQVTTQWEVEAVYTLYLVVAQIMLLNLLIAMFASTYQRIKDHAADEWRLARAQIIMEYSHEVRGVLELPVLNLVGLTLVPLCWLWRGLRRCPCLGRVTEWSRVRLPWEEVGTQKFVKVDAEAAAVHKASIAEMEITLGMYVAVDEGGRGGKVYYVNRNGTAHIRWLDTGKLDERSVSRERLALAVASPDDQAALAAAGWRAEWGLPPLVSTMHPLLDGNAAEEEEQAKITHRRSLHDSAPEDDFGEVTLHERWLDERADADPTDFAELQNTIDNRAVALERRLTEQMQEHARAQQQAMNTKVASLEEKMDQLITLVSAMQAGTPSGGD
eukprot:COSAG06_NODE_445_length_15690_cov_28.448849_1_plen_1513_part_00